MNGDEVVVYLNETGEPIYREPVSSNLEKQIRRLSRLYGKKHLIIILSSRRMEMEKKLQIYVEGDWYYVSAVTCAATYTTNDAAEALSDDYLSVVTNKFPDMTFRSI